MSFADGKPWRATRDDLRRPWDGRTDGSRFRCCLCGVRFAVGDLVARHDGPLGTFLTCRACDGPHDEVLARFERLRAELDRLWWFVRCR